MEAVEERTGDSSWTLMQLCRVQVVWMEQGWRPSNGCSINARDGSYRNTSWITASWKQSREQLWSGRSSLDPCRHSRRRFAQTV